MQDPAAHAAFVIAFDGDAVAQAVAQHPQGLQDFVNPVRDGPGLRAGVSKQNRCRTWRFGAAGESCFAVVLPSQRSQFQPMFATLPVHFTTIEQMALSQGAIARLLMACAMGAVVGMEREWRHKASGLRTSMLICMGSALFTLLSPVLAGDIGTNKGQVASNIVQGIGFLGAGLILHTRNRVLGLTSAASVWVVAAIGMACGAGLYLVSAVATVIVYVALQFVGLIESRANWKSFPMLYEVRGEDEQAMFADILAVMDRENLRLNIVDRDRVGATERVMFTVSASAGRHKDLLAKLTASNATGRVASFRDEEEE